MVEVVPSSGSIILRATHIARVRIVAATPGPWIRERSPTARRDVDLVLHVQELLKGEDPRAAEDFRIRIEQHQPSLDWAIPLPGAWSDRALDPGLEHLVFGAGHGSLASNLVVPERVDDVAELLEVKLSLDAEAQKLELAEVVARARAIAPSLSFVFSEYLWARHGARALSDERTAELVFSLLESPELGSSARTQLVSSAISDADTVPEVSGKSIGRLARALFRLLRVPSAAPLRGNIVAPYLPSLVGLSGGVPHSADEVFEGRAGERADAIRALEEHPDRAQAAPLLVWLRESRDARRQPPP